MKYTSYYYDYPPYDTLYSSLTDVIEVEPSTDSLVTIADGKSITFRVSTSDQTTVYWYVDDYNIVNKSTNTSNAKYTISSDDYGVGKHRLETKIYNNSTGAWLKNPPIWEFEIEEVEGQGEIVYVKPETEVLSDVDKTENLIFEVASNKICDTIFYVNDEQVKECDLNDSCSYKLSDMIAGNVYNVEAIANFEDGTTDSVTWEVQVKEALKSEFIDYSPDKSYIEAVESESLNFSVQTNKTCDIRWSVNDGEEISEDNSVKNSEFTLDDLILDETYTVEAIAITDGQVTDTISWEIDVVTKICEQEVEFYGIDDEPVIGKLIVKENDEEITSANGDTFRISDLIYGNTYTLEGVIDIGSDKLHETKTFEACNSSPIKLRFEAKQDQVRSTDSESENTTTYILLGAIGLGSALMLSKGKK